LTKRLVALEELMSPFVALRFLNVLPNRSRTDREVQLGLLTALTRTCEHSSFRAVHLLVHDVDAARQMFIDFGYALPAKVKAMSGTGRPPTNLDLFYYAATNLQGHVVLGSGDDLYPEGSAWNTAPQSSMVLSWHSKHESCDGCILRRCKPTSGTCSADQDTHSERIDAWVHQFNGHQQWATSTKQSRISHLLNTPPGAPHSDHLLAYVLEHLAGTKVTNRCLRYRLHSVTCSHHNGLTATEETDAFVNETAGTTTFLVARKLLRTYVKNMSVSSANQILRKTWPSEW
jgi:hypothetical protein